MKLHLSNQPDHRNVVVSETTFSITSAVSPSTERPMQSSRFRSGQRNLLSYGPSPTISTNSEALHPISYLRNHFQIKVPTWPATCVRPRVPSIAVRSPLFTTMALTAPVSKIVFGLAVPPCNSICHRFLTTLWSFCFFQPRLVYLPVAALRVGFGVNSYSLELVSV